MARRLSRHARNRLTRDSLSSAAGPPSSGAHEADADYPRFTASLHT